MNTALDEFRQVPEEMIQYRETKNFKIGFERPAGLTISDNEIYLVGDQKLKVIDVSGQLLKEVGIERNPNNSRSICR